MRKLGSVIRKYRKDLGLKVYQLAEKTGVSPEFITQVELGSKYPTIKITRKISKVLGENLLPLYLKERHPDLVAALREVKGLMEEIKAAKT